MEVDVEVDVASTDDGRRHHTTHERARATTTTHMTTTRTTTNANANATRARARHSSIHGRRDRAMRRQRTGARARDDECDERALGNTSKDANEWEEETRRPSIVARAIGVVCAATVAATGTATFEANANANAANEESMASVAVAGRDRGKIFGEDFLVKFAGFEVDHKNLIYALVLGQTVGFVGSAVGGAEAKKRALEIERLNAMLLKVNKEVRKELRSSQGRKVPTPDAAQDSMDDGNNEAVAKIIALLKSGKSKLKQQAPEEAYAAFTEALALINTNTDALNEPWKAVRKARRGLGAASSRMKKYDEALKHMKVVLELSCTHQDTTVATDAYGIIADIYAEMNQLEVAADWYDKYFKALAAEDAKDGSTTMKSGAAR